MTIDQTTHEKLEYARSLLRHRIPSGDVSEVLETALDALITQLEKQKFAATENPRWRPPSGKDTSRHIPAPVRRAVWVRDGGQCTFESKDGRRCPSRDFLEFDHVLEFALGGRANVDNLQLRCRAHNHHTAERTFGAEFMEAKRAEARGASRQPDFMAESHAALGRQGTSSHMKDELDVVPWLRALGFRADEARRAAAYCETISEGMLEDRVRAALAYLRPPRTRRESVANRAVVAVPDSASHAGGETVSSGWARAT